MPSETFWIGLAGIAGSAGLGPYLALRRERARFAHEQRLADRAELRRLLDEATAELGRAIATHIDSRRELETYEADVVRSDRPNVEATIELLARSQGCGEALSAMADRLAMRLGSEHILCSCFSHAGYTESRAVSNVFGLRVGHGSPERAVAKMNEAFTVLLELRSTLTDEGRSLIGARLYQERPSSRLSRARP